MSFIDPTSNIQLTLNLHKPPLTSTSGRLIIWYQEENDSIRISICEPKLIDEVYDRTKSIHEQIELCVLDSEEGRTIDLDSVLAYASIPIPKLILK